MEIVRTETNIFSVVTQLLCFPLLCNCVRRSISRFSLRACFAKPVPQARILPKS